MNDHISKPINVKDMFTTMAKWITPSNPDMVVAVKQGEDADTVFDISDIEGIDTHIGLLTTANNEKLYRKLLVKFRNSYTDFTTSFEAAMASDDESEAERIAHTLKGVAGNIGATEVQAKAALLEKACKDKKEGEELTALLTDVVTEIDIVLAGLAHIDQAFSPAPSQTNKIDLSVIDDLVSQLRELLEDDDTAAKDVVDKLNEIELESKQKACVDKLYNAIDEYDFETALEELNTMSRHLGL